MPSAPRLRWGWSEAERSRSPARPGRKRFCVLGLDGVPCGLLRHLAEDSIMPQVAAILSHHPLRQMRAALPPVSSVSWSSFMTGANPGVHGIFGFTEVDPQTYQLRFPLFSDLAAPTFWDKLGETGRRCAVVNQPATYPARRLPGVLVSGFVALDLAKSVWPTDHLPALRKMGYQVDVDTRAAAEDLDRLLNGLTASLETRLRAARYFWDQEDWDYFQLVDTGTDRLHHFLWQAVIEPSDPRHERAMGYYQALDRVVGQMWEWHHGRTLAAREGEGFLILSDHGFTAVRQEVRLNAWLREQGYLEYQTSEPTSVADIATGTRAFALDPGRVYINTRDRYARGCVDPAEAAELRVELAEKLRAMTWQGEPVVAKVCERERVYEGPRTPLGPDLVVLSRPGFDLKGTTRAREVFGATHFQGMHTWDDALVWTQEPLGDDPEVSGLAQVIVKAIEASEAAASR